MSKFTTALILVTAVLSSVNGYPSFLSLIPNGASVVNPCNIDELNGEAWPGVGHRNIEGGGARNPFGLDFNANGKVSVFKKHFLGNNS